MLEKDIEAALDLILGACGFTAIRFSQARATMQTPGIPDRRYVHTGLSLALWFEVKRPDGRWSEAQQQFAATCFHLNELYVVGGLDEGYEVLRALGCWDGKMLRPQGWASAEQASLGLLLSVVAAGTRRRWVA